MASCGQLSQGRLHLAEHLACSAGVSPSVLALELQMSDYGGVRHRGVARKVRTFSLVGAQTVAHHVCSSYSLPCDDGGHGYPVPGIGQVASPDEPQAPKRFGIADAKRGCKA